MKDVQPVVELCDFIMSIEEHEIGEPCTLYGDDGFFSYLKQWYAKYPEMRDSTDTDLRRLLGSTQDDGRACPLGMMQYQARKIIEKHREQT